MTSPQTALTYLLSTNKQLQHAATLNAEKTRKE